MIFRRGKSGYEHDMYIKIHVLKTLVIVIELIIILLEIYNTTYDYSV
jgi:hypothetical protein